MSAQQPQHSKYGFSKTVDIPYAEAVEKTRAALKEESKMKMMMEKMEKAGAEMPMKTKMEMKM